MTLDLEAKLEELQQENDRLRSQSEAHRRVAQAGLFLAASLRASRKAAKPDRVCFMDITLAEYEALCYFDDVYREYMNAGSMQFYEADRSHPRNTEAS